MTLTKCHIIGDDTLVTRCGEILLRQKWTVLGIFSSNLRVLGWASEHEIPVLNDLQSFEGALSSVKCDYLFSISNSVILPKSILQLPKYAAVNYHNAPLPKYGGVHATSWAILNGEKEYGVTWHTMEEGVDTGDILKQVTFAIADDETSISLNVKCHEQASSLFEKLIQDLAANKLTRTKQEKQQAKYYSLKEKVEGHGLVVWDCPAEKIYRTFRALCYPHYENRLGTIKILVGDMVFIPCSMKTVPSNRSGKPVPNGTIVEISGQHMRVTTPQGDAIITEVVDISGAPWDIKELTQHFSIKPNDVLPSAEKRLAEKLRIFASDLAHNEKYWVKTLSDAAPLCLPYFRPNSNARLPSEASDGSTPSSLSKVIPLPQSLRSRLSSSFKYTTVKDILLSTVLFYLQRTNDYDDCAVYFSNPDLRKFVGDLASFFSTNIPLALNFDFAEKKLLDVVQMIKERLDAISKHKTFEKDIFHRYPALASCPENFPITVNIYHRFETSSVNTSSLLTISILDDGLKFDINEQETYQCSSEEIIKAINSHILNLLSAIADNPNAPITRLPMLDVKEQQNLTGCDVSSSPSGSSTNNQNEFVCQTFEKQASANPENFAVVYDDSLITYQELNCRANRMARYLEKLGVKPNAYVAVSLDRSELLITTILAIFKLRATYAPLDPNYPEEQLLYMLKDTGAQILLTVKKFNRKFLSYKEGKTVYLNEVTEEISENKKSDLHLATQSQDIAYVIYTSGTTGKPKGVLVTQENLRYSLNVRLQYYAANQDQNAAKNNILMMLSTSFDTSIAVIFWPLLFGGRLTLLNSTNDGDARKTAKKISKRKITHLVCVPALYKKILEVSQIVGKGCLASLRLVILGGDSWGRDLAEQHRLLAPQATLFNEYGITECTVWSTAASIYRPTDKSISAVTIGRPRPYTQVFLLDKYMQIVPRGGFTGRMYVGGNGVAKGYLNIPQLTESRFLSLNTPNGQTVRVYDTGDEGIFDIDGNIVFAGRKDFQVKIRGMRIETEQIESCLLRHSKIKECVVVARIGSNREKYLAAYIVIKGDGVEVDQTDLRIFLGDLLPKYMIPSRFKVLASLPLTRNKKIARDQLPALEEKERHASTAYVAPETKTETQLASIFCSVLNIDKVGCNDSFFGLGGDSLSVNILLRSMRKIFSVRIPNDGFFTTPTIKYLASVIDGKGNSLASQTIASLEADSVLDVNIVAPMSGNTTTSPTVDSVFLTGPTGFLGVYLLQTLYSNTKVTIYCLVGAANEMEARAHLQKSMEANKLKAELLASERLKVVVGDLSKPRLGLSATQYDDIAKKVGIIYHCGALVHHIYNYEKLRGANVLGTLEIIKFAASYKLKAIHYVSTLSAADCDANSAIPEKFPPAGGAQRFGLKGGYAQTKWVSERLLAQAKDRGIPVNIYRPSWILGDTDTGASPLEKNRLLTLLQGCVHMRIAPDWDAKINIVPVNFVAAFIVRSAFTTSNINQVFNVYNDIMLGWRELVEFANDNYKAQIKLVSTVEWNKSLASIPSNDPLFHLLSFYYADDDAHSGKQGDLAVVGTVQSDNANKLLQALSMQYPKIDAKLLGVYFDFFIENGFLELEKKSVGSHLF